MNVFFGYTLQPAGCITLSRAVCQFTPQIQELSGISDGILGTINPFTSDRGNRKYINFPDNRQKKHEQAIYSGQSHVHE
jgi:hypothetical protein